MAHTDTPLASKQGGSGPKAEALTTRRSLCAESPLVMSQEKLGTGVPCSLLAHRDIPGLFASGFPFYI
ncbi:hypothetical protein TWF694_007524 [Orbilia ellipsospora]|uniref:Uncharacterized protein n=1 Tax=Orbilia ellipsospora TaxID=2528407 RepID=A0AAV9XHZ8_9PEZI